MTTRQASKDKEKGQVNINESVTTIYKNAVECMQVDESVSQPPGLNRVRLSSSDVDNLIDTSHQLLSEINPVVAETIKSTVFTELNSMVAGPSGYLAGGGSASEPPAIPLPQDRNPGPERVEKLIKETEASKARMMTSTVNDNFLVQNYLHTVLMDEDYMLISGHVDEVLHKKIVDKMFL